jgi:Helix-turn-helix domain of resolvase/Resolvase, N terminal domain
MIMTIFAGIAEFERDLIRERTSAGREAAQKRGVRFGRPRKLSIDQEQLARRLVLEGKAVSDVARTFNVHAATIYRLADADSSDFQIALHSWACNLPHNLGAKRYLTEHADPDQIDAHSPPEVLAGDGSIVGYYEILPYAKPVEFRFGAQTWLLDDQHCVRANCSCQEAALSFFELRPSAQHSGVVIEPTLCIRYAYDTGQIEPLSGAKDGRWSEQDFVDALKEVLPDLDPVLAKRQALLRRLYRRALSRKTIRLQAPKTSSKRTLSLWQRQKV